MTSKQRMLTALDGGIPDRLPVTTHFMMPQFLKSCMGGISEDEFFDTCGWDPITYTTPHRPDPAKNEYYDPKQGEPGFLESRRIATDQWRVELEPVAEKGTGTFCRNGPLAGTDVSVGRRTKGACPLFRAKPHVTASSRPSAR